MHCSKTRDITDAPVEERYQIQHPLPSNPKRPVRALNPGGERSFLFKDVLGLKTVKSIASIHITDLPTSSQTCQLHALWGSCWRCSYLETPNMQLIWASGARIKLWLRLMPSVQGRLVHPGQPSVRKSTNMFMSKLFWFPNTSKSALKSRHRGIWIGSTHGGCHAHLLGLAAVV